MSSSSASALKKRHVWQTNVERHHCAVCNAWMGGDRQSILLHENGKKHKENVVADLKNRREDKAKNEKREEMLKDSLMEVERIAALSSLKDEVYFGGGGVGEGGAVPIVTVSDPKVKVETASKSSEMKSWNLKRRIREEERNPEEEDVEGSGSADAGVVKESKKQQHLGPEEGHYTIGDVSYLEGQIYAPLLDEEMPIGIWTGPSQTPDIEKRNVLKQHHWKNGLVIKIHHSDTPEEEGREEGAGDLIVDSCDVAYLHDPDDEEETSAREVSPSDLRLLLGSGYGIPSTIEEARLTIMGGEEERITETAPADTADTDENTGFTSWSTVSVKKVTALQERKEERLRALEKKREERDLMEREKKDAQGRKMEEAKFSNADDSALGAYDVWNNEKGGYKGVDITKEAKGDVFEMAKGLMSSEDDGKVVEFRKRSGGKMGFKKVKKKNSRRKTFADDD